MAKLSTRKPSGVMSDKSLRYKNHIALCRVNANFLKNMDALKSEDLDHIILELHYITMEAHENPGRKEALDKMNTEEEMNAFRADIAIPQVLFLFSQKSIQFMSYLPFVYYYLRTERG